MKKIISKDEILKILDECVDSIEAAIYAKEDGNTHNGFIIKTGNELERKLRNIEYDLLDCIKEFDIWNQVSRK